MSIETREAQFASENDDATNAGEQAQISTGRDISANLLERIEAIELYVCELIEVIGQYESQAEKQDKVVVQIPFEFLKWDLLNLIAESRIDTVRLIAMLKSAEQTDAKRSGYLN